MNSETALKTNELKILTYLLSQLEKRIYLMRVSLYGAVDKEFPQGIRVSKKMLEMENDEFQKSYNISAEDYRLIIDCCDIETSLHRILNEMSRSYSYSCLKQIVQELDNERTDFKKHQKMIEDKRKQIDRLKEVLPVIQQQTEVYIEKVKSGKFDAKEKAEQKAESSENIAFLKKLMGYKLESKRNYYNQQQTDLEQNIEWFERETRTQSHADVQIVSFWLLKFDQYTGKLDSMLKQMFDEWSERRRELNLLKKYRKINQEKIQSLQKLISEREEYIENDRKEQDEKRKKEEEDLKKLAAIIKIQAFWRGTMVRKHLGPYKVKKSKKGKGKKGKGKGDKGKKGAAKKKK